MKIKTHIRIFQVIVAVAVVTLAIIAYTNLRSDQSSQERVRLANLELQAVMRIAMFANDYSEQIAEVMLIGDAELPDLDTSRREMRQSFVRLRRLIDEEMRAITDPIELARERDDLARIARMEAIFASVDRAAVRVLALDRQGRRPEAIALFHSEIEHKFNEQLEELIVLAVAGERREVARAESLATARSLRVMASTMGVAAVMVLVTVGAGVLFSRAVSRPIDALAEGALAIGRGDLGYRIALDGPNEFGVLSRRFNEMAGELDRQRSELLAARADLEAQVEQRTQELADSNARLTQLDRLRIRFLADASHELRTPLTVLRGEAEVALRGATKPEAVYREALDRIIEQVTDMNRLVDDLLFVSRSEADEIRFELQRINLPDVVADAVREAGVLGLVRQVEVVFDRPKRSLTVLADPPRLRQALLTILDNAVRYSKPGAQVAVVVRASDSTLAEVVVRDRGDGIAPEDLPHIFERFYRGQAARAQVPGGSGLGLSIALWIAERHGGMIKATSTRGKGTSLRVQLPMAA